MITIDSKIEGHELQLQELERLLSPLGYSLGGNWDYDHGCYDYKVSDEDGYTFLRIPFSAVNGEIGDRNAVVKIGKPYLLHHVYQAGNDEQADGGVVPATMAGAFNQFQAPVDRDADVDPKYAQVTQNLVAELEQTLLA
ncbi:YugN-like family protein [Shouchella lonarensis]|uniref:YugN-like family protein n=1 Tax=Shouchella lonarensis TaxID=1464122 RepID=A0A1G6H3R8_9BACI|nr:YugN-like family protein [Shouchella lonarensis]SDB88565.1 YugN-like family protein [Shouchella lonarensis]